MKQDFLNYFNTVTKILAILNMVKLVIINNNIMCTSFTIITIYLISIIVLYPSELLVLIQALPVLAWLASYHRMIWWCHQMESFSALLIFNAGGIHRSPVTSPHRGRWHGALMFSLICAWINGWVNNREAGYSWVNNREAGDLRRHRAHYYVTVMN